MKKKVKKWRGELYDPIETWYDRNLDIENRTIYCGLWHSNSIIPGEDHVCEVDDLLAQNIIKSLYLLDKNNHDPITLIWFSFGGDWDAGMSIYDYIKKTKSPVIMRCYGRVRSMGTIILQATDERLLSPNCLFMIHYGTAGSELTHEKDFEMFTKQLIRERRKMENIYLNKICKKQPSYSRKDLRDLLKYDKYLTPKQAVKLGLADGIIK